MNLKMASFVSPPKQNILNINIVTFVKYKAINTCRISIWNNYFGGLTNQKSIYRYSKSKPTKVGADCKVATRNVRLVLIWLFISRLSYIWLSSKNVWRIGKICVRDMAVRLYSGFRRFTLKTEGRIHIRKVGSPRYRCRLFGQRLTYLE